MIRLWALLFACGVMHAGTFAPLSLSERLERSSIVVEGTIINAEKPFYDNTERLIFTSYKLAVKQVIKGNIKVGDTIIFLIEGGQVGTTMYVNTAEIMPPEGSNVIVYLTTKAGRTHPAFKGYSFLFIESNKVRDILQTYPLSTVEKELNISLKRSANNTNSNRSFAPIISSVSPTTVCAGCWDTLVIQGSNFGNSRGPGDYVAMYDPDAGGGFVPIDSPQYYIYWDNFKIEVLVPFTSNDRVGTGPVKVCAGGTCDSTDRANPIVVSYALNQVLYQGQVYDVHYYNANGSGGYSIQPSSVFKSNLQRWLALKRAMKTWRCGTFVNIDTLSGTTTINTQANDGVFVAAFTNIDGVGGTLAFAAYWYNAQWNSATNSWDWRISHFDLVFDDAEPWYYGTGTPSSTQRDFESVALHELGHAIGLGHVINISDVMYYAYRFNRNLSGSNIAAVTQKLNYSISGTHAHATMVPLNQGNCNFLCELQVQVTYDDPHCNGASSGWIKVEVLSGTPPYTHSWTPNPPFRATAPDGSSDSAYALQAGTWEDLILDANQCPGYVQVTLTDPPPLTITIDSIVHVGCAGDSTGAIYTTVTGGVPPYTYYWNFTPAPSEDTTGLPAGFYDFAVTDANGCTQNVIAINVWEHQPLNITLDSIVSPKCHGDSTGQIYITVTGGTAPYLYLWSTGDTTQDLTNAPAGQYTLNMVDSHGCSLTKTYTITEPAAINATISWNPPSTCGNDGNASVNVSGGTPPYSIQWSNGQTGSSVNIPAGVYTVSITDNNGCSWDSTVTFNEPNGPQITLDSVVDVKCFGDSTGAIYITTIGGAPPYTFQWSNGSTTEDLINIPAGLYTITVSGADQCKSFNSFTVNEPPPLVVSIYYDSLTHQMWTIISGGTPPYSIEWNNTLTVDTILIIGPGSYWVEVIDNNGCTAYDTLIINGQPSATFNPFDENCSLLQHNTGIFIDCYNPIIMLDLYNITGKSIISLKPYIHSLKVDNLTKGLYILKVHTNNQVLTRKIIIH
ncbi:MAG: T9SS type A sorting domain-containing protein [Chlorobi bacterium]|nr:T9SS type A sorting domain-containing protein [Chlorobiota bacterium]